jgi:hypothetical protein
MGGDSGSAWMIDGEESDVIVGLHFAGDDVPSPTVEYALACNIHSVLEKLDVTLDDPAADPQSHRERIDALAQQVAMLTARLAATASGGGGCSCGGHRTTDASAAAELGLPVYGRWCGPGHGGDGPPIDDVDRACMTHDNCYGSRGWGDCSCNRELQANIDAALRAGQVRPLGRVVGPIMRRWFDFQPCVNRGGGVGEAAGGSMLNGAMGNGAMLNATMINGMPPPGVRPSLRRSPPRAGLPAPQARGRHFQ